MTTSTALINITIVQASFNTAFTLSDPNCMVVDQMAHYKMIALLVLSILRAMVEAMVYFFNYNLYHHESNHGINVKSSSHSLISSSARLHNIPTPTTALSFSQFFSTKLRDYSVYYSSFLANRPFCEKKYSSFSSNVLPQSGDNATFAYSGMNPSFEVLSTDLTSLRTKSDFTSTNVPIYNQHNNSFVWKETIQVLLNDDETTPIIISFKQVDDIGKISLLGFISFSLYSVDLSKSSLVTIPLQYGDGNVLVQITSDEQSHQTSAIVSSSSTIPSIDLLNHVSGYDTTPFPSRSIESMRKGIITEEELSFFDPITIDEMYKQAITGDVILFSGNELVSLWVQSSYLTTWSHVGMLLKNPPIELLVEYQVDPKYYSTLNDTVFYVDADDAYSSMKSKNGGIQIVELKEFMDSIFSTNPTALIAWRKLEIPNRQIDHESLYKFISTHKTFGFEGNVLELMRAAPKQNSVISEDSMFCSEFVGASFKQMKIIPSSVCTNNIGPYDFSSEFNLIQSIMLKGAYLEKEKRIKKNL